jgi:uncharacterized caspase-like protein
MRSKFNFLVAFVFSALSLSGCATPAPRVAIVIGNGEYQHTSPLTNPPNDARAIGERLAAQGWAVSTVIDLPRAELQGALASFEKQVARADQAIFFYAGHSLQINGENYLMPVEFEPNSETAEIDLVSINETIARLATAPGQIAVLLDASRDNPLAIVYQRTSRRREAEELQIGLGLAEVPVDDGMFIALSTAPGHVAFDGSVGHSPFSRAILNHIDLKNQDVRTLLVRVRNEVMTSTGGSQVPWDYSSLIDDFWIDDDSVAATTK